MTKPQFFDPYGDIRQTANRLPHWQQRGATYFVTFRLADSIPAKLREQWDEERQNWIRTHPEPWDDEAEHEYHKRFSGAIERWLDAGHGSCVLRQPKCAAIVIDALRHFDNQRLILIAGVVMPNHVHLVLIQNPEVAVEDLLQSWKRFSTRGINRLLSRSGSLWQRDYFDRLVRDEQHLANCIRYIRRNPAKAGLRPGEYLLYEAELAKGIE